MATVIAHNILSPLGLTSEANYLAVKSGKASLRPYEKAFGTPLSITASAFDENTKHRLQLDEFTWFESVVIQSVRKALSATAMDVSDEKSGFILSTTKANVESVGALPDEAVLPGTTAKKIAVHLGFTTEPVVVCNACISGVAALITASRLIDAGIYNKVVVCGCDILGKFIVSGFDSLKALSPEACRPFDEERLGLNLGEATATIVLSKEKGKWHIGKGAICNDAYHISTPSPNGLGSGMALQRVSEGGTEDLAFVNLHGTATMYNDQMEWKALEQAKLTDVPANALKGYFGHTMGAAGIMECILSMMAADEGIVLGTRGFQTSGVSGNILLSPNNRFSDKDSFIKLISGFGGCNAAIYFTCKKEPCYGRWHSNEYTTLSRVCISDQEIYLNQQLFETIGKGQDSLVELYKRVVSDYPRFYKMDGLSRLGLLAAELLFNSLPDFDQKEKTGIILFNRTSSLCADKKYLQTIRSMKEFFPSPAAFVYTLPNIVNGEIALRHHLHEETSFYILPDRDEKTMKQVLEATLMYAHASCFITGWIDYTDEAHFCADLKLIRK